MCKKICKICKIEKDCSEFHKMKGCLYGVRTVCKICRKEEKEEYSSRPEVIERQKKYYHENKESFRKRMSLHYWSLNGQYHEYKKRAKASNKEFLLSQEDCKQFYQTGCYYCGDILKALGIDRKDSKKGYILNNCVPCCPTCNFMKYTLTQEQFVLHIRKVLNHLNL